jgi:hypothetical protein
MTNPFGLPDDIYKNINSRIKRSFIPLIFDPQQSKPIISGTGVLVRVGENYFVFTAGHCVKFVEDSSRVLIAADGIKRGLRLPIIKTFRFHTETNGGFDYGIIEVPGMFCRELEDVQAFDVVYPFNMITANETLPEDNIILISGYPSASGSWDKNQFGMSITTMGGPINFYNCKPYEQPSNVPLIGGIETLELELKRSDIQIFIDEGKISKDPDDLRGMSGCGAWILPNTQDVKPEAAKLFAFLYGHITQERDGENYIILRMVKSSSHINLIYDNYPTLRERILEEWPELPKIWKYHAA